MGSNSTGNATTDSIASTSLKMGLILGLVYAILIFVENSFFYQNPLVFGGTKTVGYLLFLTGLFFIGFQLKKQQNGYISFKDCLKGLLIAIVVAELIYAVFSIMYVKVIEPGFFDKMKNTWEEYFRKMNVPGEAVDEALKRFDEGGKLTFLTTVGSYGMSIVIDAIFAIIIAAVLKKNKPEIIEDTSFENFGLKS